MAADDVMMTVIEGEASPSLLVVVVARCRNNENNLFIWEIEWFIVVSLIWNVFSITATRPANNSTTTNGNERPQKPILKWVSEWLTHGSGSSCRGGETSQRHDKLAIQSRRVSQFCTQIPLAHTMIHGWMARGFCIDGNFFVSSS